MKNLKTLVPWLIIFALLVLGAKIKTDHFGTYEERHILATTSTSLTDSTMIDSVSFTYPAQQAETVYYKFLDTGTVATTMYFEARLTEGTTIDQYAIIDSLVVSTTSTDWRVWNITDSAVGIHYQWRLRKSTISDTLQAIQTGTNPNR